MEMLYAKVYIIVLAVLAILSLGVILARLGETRTVTKTYTIAHAIGTIIGLGLIVMLAYSIGWWF